VIKKNSVKPLARVLLVSLHFVRFTRLLLAAGSEKEPPVWFQDFTTINIVYIGAI
jgi:hypothetical protein